MFAYDYTTQDCIETPYLGNVTNICVGYGSSSAYQKTFTLGGTTVDLWVDQDDTGYSHMGVDRNGCLPVLSENDLELTNTDFYTVS